MNWREWYSYDSAWAILRRGLIVGGIGFIVAISWEFSAGNPKSHYFWFPCIGVPMSLTVINLLFYFAGREKTKHK